MLYELLIKNPFQRRFLIFLIFANILGAVFGYYWYVPQLAVTPKALWLFTFDCPFYATLFAFTMLTILLGWNIKLLQLLAYTGVIKYGIWTTIVIMHFWLTTGSPEIITLLLFISHFGMAVEGIIFIRHLYLSGAYIGFIAVWFIINDYLDYVVGIHPYLYHQNQYTIAMASALFFSVILVVYLWRYRLKSRYFIFKN